MRFESERSSSLESQESYSSKIVLEFFRHAEKEKAAKPDQEIELTPRGRAQAIARSQEGDIDQSVAFGSFRKRTQQTAGFAMAGRQEDITGDETLEQLKQKLDDGLRFGSKIAVDPRLDYVSDEKTPLGAMAEEAAVRGKYFEFLVHQSDAEALKLGDEAFTTYRRAAASIAQVVQKYIKIAPRWDKLVQESKRASYRPALERHLGTHQGMAESFIARYLELTRGVPERDRFVEALSGAGFGFAEGCSVEIRTRAGEEGRVHLSYRGGKQENSFELDEDVPPEVLSQIGENR